MKKRLFLTLAAAGLTAASALAQGNGLSGITEATSMVTSYFDPLTRLIYAVESRRAGTPDAETAAALQETITAAGALPLLHVCVSDSALKDDPSHTA